MAFSFSQATNVKEIFEKYQIRYMFIGKSGAIILGYSDTTQDVDVFPEKNPVNCLRLINALLELKFDLSDTEKAEIARGKTFVQLKNGPFDIDLIFAPDGIESFSDAWNRKVERNGYPVCHIDDIVNSKKSANRVKDRESLGRLIKFQEWLKAYKN